MGEVYRARDIRLDRTVAIKVLTEQIVVDADRRARFEREARAVAALNHPHICDLYDVGEAPRPAVPPSSADSIRFLVMEYLEGQTLGERLLRGPLPTLDLLRYAVQLADALDHAHRRGLVHRDLKPGNVMLTKEGAKLLDFGLSKHQTTPDLLALSTVSPGAAPLTAAGAVLGTFPYMAPEQLMGREADARSDIFALGAMMYEMVTGRRAFEGTTAATVIGAVLHTDPPPISSSQSSAAALLNRIISRCLAKDPDDRWQTARDLTLELKWIDPATVPPVNRAGRKRRKVGSMAAAALAVVAIAAAVLAVAYGRRAPVEGVAVRFSFSPPKELNPAEVRFGGPVTISPDGTRLVYVATGSDGKQLLWVHPLDSAVPHALAGTDGAAYPFWSPDGRFIGFFAEGRLKRIDATGGPPQILSEARLPRGGTWSRAGMIVFSAGAGTELYRLSAAGGPAMPVPADGVNDERQWPSFLPDGRHILYFGRRQAPGIYVASLESGSATLLASGLYMGATYTPPGYLLLFKGGSMAGTLLAQPFDANRRQFTGEPVPLAEQVPFYPFYARADFSVSENGTLLHGTFGGQRPTELVWFDRSGKRLTSVPGAIGYSRAELSPDEKTIAADRVDPETQSQDVWLIETTRGVTSRLTTNPGLDNMGLWSPDGSRIVYGSVREGEARGTRLKVLSGAGPDEQLFGGSSDARIHQTTDWSRDGRLIVYGRLDPKTKWDVWVVPAAPNLTGDRTPIVYLQTEFNEHQGRLSPDGQWMAYASDESGRSEVYVQAFPSPGVRSQISTGGGSDPAWRRDGKELFYQSDDRLMAVTVKADTSFTMSPPRELFRMNIAKRGAQMARDNGSPYVPTADGQRFLINALIEAPPPPPVTVILHWPAARRR
jgi:serine/threonine protein kinase/Tol biopolymer transport system component